MSTILPFLRPPSVVVVYLKEPREKFWGLVRSLDGSGLVIQGVDVNSFDDWVRSVTEGRDSPHLSMVYFPLLRVEKILVDASSETIPSLAEHFRRRVGRSLADYLDERV
jgi:hypothetical protein